MNHLTLRVTTETFQEFRVFVASEYGAGSWRWHIQRQDTIDGITGPCRDSSSRHGSRIAVAAAMTALLDWAAEGMG